MLKRSFGRCICHAKVCLIVLRFSKLNSFIENSFLYALNRMQWLQTILLIWGIFNHGDCRNFVTKELVFAVPVLVASIQVGEQNLLSYINFLGNHLGVNFRSIYVGMEMPTHAHVVGCGSLCQSTDEEYDPFSYFLGSVRLFSAATANVF